MRAGKYARQLRPRQYFGLQSRFESGQPHKPFLEGIMSAPEEYEIAKARDEWIASEDGRGCTKGNAYGKYLEARLERAFLAGWEAARKEMGK